MTRGRRVARIALGVVAALAAAGALALAGCRYFGESARGARLARIEQSPEWHGERFANAQAMWSDLRDAFMHALAVAPASGLRVTWFGHSATLIEIDGQRVLTDPIWSERASGGAAGLPAGAPAVQAVSDR